MSQYWLHVYVPNIYQAKDNVQYNSSILSIHHLSDNYQLSLLVHLCNVLMKAHEADHAHAEWSSSKK
jgi:hypothetical protein